MAAIDTQNYSGLQKARLAYQPALPAAFAGSQPAALVAGEATVAHSASDEAALRSWFPSTLGQRIVSFAPPASAAAPSSPVAAPKPLRVGVVFSGRQCPGGHNAVAGLYDALQLVAPGSTVLGFVGGTAGLLGKKAVELNDKNIAPYRNQGGYHMLGRSVDKIRTPAEQAAALAAASELSLDGLVLLGGTFTATDAAHLAEHFARQGSATRVIGVPATIDGDLKGQFVEQPLGFDTAAKITAQLVGNLETDCNSAKKYVYFARVLGREHGHVALEVALQTRPNAVLLGEDIEARKLTLADIVAELADAVSSRAAAGKNYAVIVLPEGLVAYIPELRSLIAEINRVFSAAGPGAAQLSEASVAAKLTPWSKAVLEYLPPVVRQQLFLERESSGAVQLSQISTERMLLELVNEELGRRKAAGVAAAKPGNGMGFFLGYQARSALPSNFDCSLGTALGYTAAHLVAAGKSGYLATVSNLGAPVAQWKPAGVPLTALLSVPAPGSSTAPAQALVADGAHRGLRPAVLPAPVDVHGGAFQSVKAAATAWLAGEAYTNPGPIQFAGRTASDTTLTLATESRDYAQKLTRFTSTIEALRAAIVPGVAESALDTALSGVESLAYMLERLLPEVAKAAGAAAGKQ